MGARNKMTRIKLDSIFEMQKINTAYEDCILATMAEVKEKQEIKRDHRTEVVEFIIGECESERSITDIFYDDGLLIRTMINPTFSKGMMTRYPGDTYSVDSYKTGVLNGISKKYSTTGLLENLSLFSNGEWIKTYSFSRGSVTKTDWKKLDKNGQGLFLRKLLAEDIDFLKLNAPEIRRFQI